MFAKDYADDLSATVRYPCANRGRMRGAFRLWVAASGSAKGRSVANFITLWPAFDQPRKGLPRQSDLQPSQPFNRTACGGCPLHRRQGFCLMVKISIHGDIHSPAIIKVQRKSTARAIIVISEPSPTLPKWAEYSI
ncbi:hypothetical protein JQ596_16590 [Bradyrhizobium manausense]|uniref:hypothetical protein n=1 Tax=Bradyrhizobium manausense TaxID=989370 RepID=UPI001BA7DA7B|nr:hypothetical protein [Bradyrhizobium manausense]MBR0827158.1 hypothetical protein [Bradyrhizobium manausense]